MQPVVSYASVEKDKYRVATVPVATQSSLSSRSPRTSGPKVSAWSFEARLKEKERQIKRTELKAKQAMQEARFRHEEEDRNRRSDEEKKREKARIEAERVQRQLRGELKRHQLNSRMLQQQLELERGSSRSVAPIEASGDFFSQPKVIAAASPVSSAQQRPESSVVSVKGALAKVKDLFSTFKTVQAPSSHGPAEESRSSKISSRSLKLPWSDLKNGWMKIHRGDERAAQQTAKSSLPTFQSVSTTDREPRAGEFESARVGSTPLLESSVSVTQPRSFGDQPPGGGGATFLKTSQSTNPASSCSFPFDLVSSKDAICFKPASLTACVASVSVSSFHSSRSAAAPPSTCFASRTFVRRLPGPPDLNSRFEVCVRACNDRTFSPSAHFKGPLGAEGGRMLEPKVCTSTAPEEASAEKRCAQCERPHHTKRCSQSRVSSVKKRAQVVEKRKPCFMGLEPGHMFSRCKIKKSFKWKHSVSNKPPLYDMDVSTPRRELCSCLVSVRMATTLLKELSIRIRHVVLLTEPSPFPDPPAMWPVFPDLKAPLGFAPDLELKEPPPKFIGTARISVYIETRPSSLTPWSRVNRTMVRILRWPARCRKRKRRNEIKPEFKPVVVLPTPILKKNPTSEELAAGVNRLVGRVQRTTLVPDPFGRHLIVLSIVGSPLMAAFPPACLQVMAILQFVPVKSNKHSPWSTPPKTQHEVWIPAPCRPIRQCRQSAAKTSAPLIAALPAARLQLFQPTFACTCVYHFGPIEVKNLRGGQSELDEVLERLKCSNFYSQWALVGVEWQFNPPDLPHFYESWERLVGSSIGALERIPYQQSFTDQTLSAALKEPEHLSRNRPLTCVIVYPSAPEPLTTFHLSPDRDNPAIQPDIAMSSHLSCLKRWRVVKAMAKIFGMATDDQVYACAKGAKKMVQKREKCNRQRSRAVHRRPHAIQPLVVRTSYEIVLDLVSFPQQRCASKTSRFIVPSSSLACWSRIQRVEDASAAGRRAGDVPNRSQTRLPQPQRQLFPSARSSRSSRRYREDRRVESDELS